MAKPRFVASTYVTVDAERSLEALRSVTTELHTMSQPMTALLCSLEIGAMTGTIEGYADAVRESLVQCDRLMQSIGAMRTAIAGTVERS